MTRKKYKRIETKLLLLYSPPLPLFFIARTFYFYKVDQLLTLIKWHDETTSHVFILIYKKVVRGTTYTGAVERVLANDVFGSKIPVQSPARERQVSVLLRHTETYSELPI